jgi:hypothetical protein
MDRMLALNSVMIAGNHDLACIGSTKVNIDEFNPDAKSANIWNRISSPQSTAKFWQNYPWPKRLTRVGTMRPR